MTARFLLLLMLTAAGPALLRADLAQVKAESNLEKRSKLALDLAEGTLKEARTVYNNGDSAKVTPLIAPTFNLDPPLGSVGFAGLKHQLEANPRTAYQFDLGINCDSTAAGLRIIGDPVLTSEAILVRREGAEEIAAVAQLRRRLRGVLVARRYVLLDYDCPNELLERATAVVLTCPWHRRDATQLGLPIHVPPPDAHDADPVSGEVFGGGDSLPIGVQAFEAFEPNDLVLYVESRRAVIAGDTLIDRGEGLQIHPSWPVDAVTPQDVAARLRPLLDLPVDIVLPTHAQPADRQALERELSAE